mmetsp:Transcript_1099/g.3748  ORF Transcript_1099/g.3748 Transcript_1099/m.3748 type:complete len:220 (+) Transcript_1099:2957-3616(+)
MPSHRVGLATPGLAVRKDGTRETADHLLDDGGHRRRKDVLLGRGRAEDLIVLEVLWVAFLVVEADLVGVLNHIHVDLVAFLPLHRRTHPHKDVHLHSSHCIESSIPLRNLAVLVLGDLVLVDCSLRPGRGLGTTAWRCTRRHGGRLEPPGGRLGLEALPGDVGGGPAATLGTARGHGRRTVFSRVLNARLLATGGGGCLQRVPPNPLPVDTLSWHFHRS